MNFVFNKKIVWLFFFSMTICTTTFASELSLKSHKSANSSNTDISFEVNKATNIAGIKIALTYTPSEMKYVSLTKSKATMPLMHIVNSKKPGRLIIVMAGAKGVKGSKLELFKTTFERIAPHKKSYNITITTVELISDELKNVKCNYKKTYTIRVPSGSRNHP